nr:dipeptide epimerase [Sporosarcina sp. P33]
MQICTVETFVVSSSLRKPFSTALRTVHDIQSVIVKITANDGRTGWGEAVPTHVITGDSLGGIRHVITHVFTPLLAGQDISRRELLLEKVQQSIIGNTSAKAAVDMAIYDLFAQFCGLPLMNALGGYHCNLTTDLTVSVGSPAEMANEAAEHAAKGFRILKVKVGTGSLQQERERIQAIRQAVGPHIAIRLDANQGWSSKEAIRLIRQMEDDGFNLELIEQPVAAYDVEGLRDVTRQTSTPIMADESLFSAMDAVKLLKMRAVDVLNIKLMKSGGSVKP